MGVEKRGNVPYFDVIKEIEVLIKTSCIIKMGVFRCFQIRKIRK